MSKKINKYSELYIKRRNQAILDQIDSEDFDSFEIATDSSIKNHREQLKELTDIYEEIENEISANYSKLSSYDTEEQSYLIDKQLYYEEEIDKNNAYLDSLFEMKIIYLFKSLEISMKFLIKYAYPTINVKAFYQWESMKDFFKSKEIDLFKIDGYIECLDLKKINNCIKHSSMVNDEVRKIVEFKAQSNLGHDQLEKFYNRVKFKVRVFCRELKNEIKEDLYTFSDERLEKLTRNYYERMDDETFGKFIEKLNNRIQ